MLFAGLGGIAAVVLVFVAAFRAIVVFLVTVFVLGLIAAITIPGLLRACCGGNEASAIGSLRSVNSSQSTYSSSCGGNGYAQSLQDLALPPAGSTQGFISPDLASNGVIKSGYIVTVERDLSGTIVTQASATCNSAHSDAVSSYFAEAHPVVIGKTGQRSFATDSRGTIYFNNSGERIRPGMAGASVLQ